MSTKVGQLTLEMAANIARLESDMRKARNTVDNTMRSFMRSANMAMQSIQGLIGVMSVRELAQISDQFKTINATLALATRSAAAGELAYQQVFDIAMKTGQAVSGVAVTYRRFAENSKELGITQEQVAKATETVAQTLALSGGSYQSTQAALVQFSQALAAGTLRGEELNSVLEQAPRLARLIADGLNVPIGSLRSLAAEGKITSEVIVKALESQAGAIEREFGQLPMTFSRAVNNFQTAVTNLVGNVEKSLGVFGALSGSIDYIAQNLSLLVNVVIAGAITAMGRLTVSVVALISSKIALAASIGAATTATLAFNRALTLLGGPVGAAITAASAAYAFRSELGLVSKEYAKAITATDEFNEGIKATGGFWSSLVTIGTTNPFLSLEEQVAKYRAEVEKLRDEKTRLNVVQQEFLNTGSKLELAQNRLAYFEALLAKQTRVNNQARQEGAVSMDTHTAAYLKMIGGADDYLKKLEEEYELLGLTNEERIVAIGTRKLEELGFKSGSEAFEMYLGKIRDVAQRMGVKREQIRLAEESAKSAKREAEEYKRMIEAADELVGSLQFENRTLEMSNREREIAIQLRKLEALGIKEGTAEYEKYSQAILESVTINESIKERLKLEEELQKERIKQEEDYAKEVERINDQIGQSLADALMEGGKSAKDFLIGMFKTMVLRPLLQPMITGVVGAMGFGAAGAAMAGTTGAGGAAGGSMNLMSMGSALKSAYELVTGSFTSLGAAVSDFAIEAGFQMMSSGAESAGIAMMESAATLGSVASYLGGIGAGLGLGNLISGGKSIGGSSWIGVGGGTAIGAMVGGPIGAAVGGILGGVINAAFGSGAKEYTDTGITGTLSAMAADVEEYSKWKKAGGWFTSTKRGTEFRALNSELQGTLDAALRGIGGSVAYFARSLGQPTDAINSFSQSINISFKDLSEQEIQQKIQEAVSGFEAGLIAAVFPSLSTFAYAGESAGDTLKRLSDRLSMVNKVFEALGFRLNEISLSGADAANKLVELTGGIDAFTQKVDFYYQNFYSVQERLNKNTDQLTSVFSELGMTLPTTREAFRAIVDVFQQSGSTTLLATMLNIAGAFNEYITAVEQAEQRTVEIMLARMQEGATIENRLLQALNQVSELRNRELNALDESNRALQQHVYGLEDAQNAYSSAVEATSQAFDQLKQAISVELQSALNALTKDFEDFTDSITQQQQALESAQQVANQNLNSLKGLFDFIGNQIDDLVGSTEETVASGVAFIQNALFVAKASGYLPEQNELAAAITAAKGGLGSENFATAFEMQRANKLLANDLSALKAIANEQMSDAEKQIEVAQQQLESLQERLEQARIQYENSVNATNAYYDAQLIAAQQQINILNGINTSVLSVAAATNNLSLLMDNQRQATVALAKANADALIAAQQAAARREQELAAAKAAADEKARAAEAAAIAAANAAAERARAEEAARVAAAAEAERQRQAASAAAASQAAQRPPTSATLSQDDKIRAITNVMGWNPFAGIDGSTWGGMSVDDMYRQYVGAAATGGYVSPGMMLVGEEGPELVNFRSPGMVYTSAQTQNLLGGSGGQEIIGELRSLREDQRAQSKALVSLQSRMTRIIERWEGDGMPSTRYEGATA